MPSLITMLSLTLGKWFYSHGLETMLIIGATFTAVGFFFGYLLWRHYQHNVRRIQATNAKLKDKITILENYQTRLSEGNQGSSLASETANN